MKRGVGKIVCGVATFIFGLIALPVAGVLIAVLGQPVADSFPVPGSFQTTVEKPGRYTLWHDHRTVFNGRAYNRPKDLPDGLTIRVTNMETGKDLEFVSARGATQSTGKSASVSIGHVDIAKPGRISVEVTGNAEETIFSFSRFSVGRMLGWLFAILAVSLLVDFAGIGLVIWGIVQLVRSGERKGEALPPKETPFK